MPVTNVEASTDVDLDAYDIAVILPCYNEAETIAQTITMFQTALPTARIYVFDNNSTDETAEIARKAGAHVGFESRPGKGNVVRRMFADVEADIYVMADGDATYDASGAAMMISRLIAGNLDMINGARRSTDPDSYRRGHRFGNRVLNGIASLLFSKRFEDMLSGYRVFSRRFVKTFPALSKGFEIETELTVHALQLRMPVDELPVTYRARPENSMSKLSTYADGLRILLMIGLLVKEEKPLAFFSIVAALIFVPSVAVFLSVLADFLATGEVERFPSLFTALSGIVISALSVACGIVLDTISRGRRESRHRAYLGIRGPRTL